MTYHDEIPCPGCWRHLDPSELCEHDQGDHGPLCERCCRYWHDDDGSEAA